MNISKRPPLDLDRPIERHDTYSVFQGRLCVHQCKATKFTSLEDFARYVAQCADIWEELPPGCSYEIRYNGTLTAVGRRTDEGEFRVAALPTDLDPAAIPGARALAMMQLFFPSAGDRSRLQLEADA